MLLLISCSGTARELDCYIIDKNGDKIYGLIRVTNINYPNGAISINNINYIPLYISINFKVNGAKQYVEYFADDIDGFSFIDNGQEIFFFSLQLPFQSWGKPKYQKRFLRSIINGELILFDYKSQVLYGYNYYEVTDYYISDRTNRILKISDNYGDSFEDYLIKELKIEKEFLRNQPYKINIKNLKEIIYNYNRWSESKGENHD